MSSEQPNMDPTTIISKALESLLTTQADPREFSRRLFEINVLQAAATSPELAWLLRACAIPRQIDKHVVGVLLARPDDTERNRQLLDELCTFGFVQARADGGFVYHDNIRDMLLEEWQRDASKVEFLELSEKLATHFVNNGQILIESGKYAEALARLNQAVELAPNRSDTHLWRGGVYITLGNYDTATTDLSNAIPLRTSQTIYYWRGVAYSQLDRREEGIKDFSTALDLPVDDGYPYIWQGNVLEHADSPARIRGDILSWRAGLYARIGDLIQAVDDYSRAIELRPESSYLYQRRGHAHYIHGDLDQGLADFLRAIELQPENGSNYYWRGRAHIRRADYESALADFSRAIELQPEDGYNYYWRGSAMLRLFDRNQGGDLEQALGDLSRAIELQPEHGYSYNWRGRVHYKRGEYEAALADFSRAIELQPGAGNNYNWRASTTLELFERNQRGDLEQAFGDLSRAIELQPESVDNYYWRGRVNYRLSDYEAASADFSRAIELQPGSSNFHHWQGRIHLDQNDFKSACVEFSRAIEIRPDNGNNYYWRALTELAQEQFEQAERDLRTAMERRPDGGLSVFWQAVALQLYGDTMGAEAAIDRAVTLVSTETKECLRERQSAKLALFTQKLDLGRTHYLRVFSSCDLRDLHTERFYLRLLTQLFPDRTDIAEMRDWFEAQFQRILR